MINLNVADLAIASIRYAINLRVADLVVASDKIINLSSSCRLSYCIIFILIEHLQTQHQLKEHT